MLAGAEVSPVQAASLPLCPLLYLVLWPAMLVLVLWLGNPLSFWLQLLLRAQSVTSCPSFSAFQKSVITSYQLLQVTLSRESYTFLFAYYHFGEGLGGNQCVGSAVIFSHAFSHVFKQLNFPRNII